MVNILETNAFIIGVGEDEGLNPIDVVALAGFECLARDERETNACSLRAGTCLGPIILADCDGLEDNQYRLEIAYKQTPRTMGALRTAIPEKVARTVSAINAEENIIDED